MLVGLTAGSPAVRRNTGRFESFQNSLQIASLGFSWRLIKVQCYYSVTNAFQSVFSGKIHCEASCGGTKKWNTMFFCVNLYY